MKVDERIRKINGIIFRAGKKFTSIPAGSVDKYNKRNLKNLMNNFLFYAKALTDIDLIARGKKEIWANCPYCSLKFTKIVDENEKKKVFWCEFCQKGRE